MYQHRLPQIVLCALTLSGCVQNGANVTAAYRGDTQLNNAVNEKVNDESWIKISPWFNGERFNRKLIILRSGETTSNTQKSLFVSGKYFVVRLSDDVFRMAREDVSYLTCSHQPSDNPEPGATVHFASGNRLTSCNISKPEMCSYIQKISSRELQKEEEYTLDDYLLSEKCEAVVSEAPI